jgi:RNA recognition motif-containing protein
MSVRLYVGNLPEDVNRQDLETAFTEAGTAASIKLITDRKTNKCRGFGFVTVKTDEEADQFIEKFNGQTVAEITLKIEKALPRAKGEEDGAPTSTVAAPVPASAGKGKKGGGNKGGGGGGGDRSRSNSGGGGGGGNRAAHVDLESVQPDPRWAGALEQLKERLAAQTTSS